MYGKRIATVVAGVFAVLLFIATPAQAAIVWEEPPHCVESQWHTTKDGQTGYYTKASEYQDVRVDDAGKEVKYIWVFQVEVPVAAGPAAGMVPAGRSEKHCGTDWFPNNSNIA